MIQKQTRLIVRTSPIRIPSDSGISRIPPRPESKRQSDYLEKFDSDTLFYDVFASDGDVVLSGPPLLNLKKELSQMRAIDARGVELGLKMGDLDRTQRSFIENSQNVDYIKFECAALTADALVGQDLLHLFVGKKVLLTKSKNNHLQWIHDWAKFHVENHGVDAILLYDNASTEYTSSDILAKLDAIKNLNTVVIVDWPFKFGPQGGDWGGVKDAAWDSDFSEYGILEHARYRFLKQSRAVISADIDELVIVDQDVSIFSVLESADSAALSYHGRWIETIGEPSGTIPAFSDYTYFDSRRAKATTKWTLAPTKAGHARQWKTHRIDGIDATPAPNTLHRHFMGINSNWKRSRTVAVKYDAARHFQDQDLIQALNMAGLSPHVGTKNPSESPQEISDNLLRSVRQLFDIESDSLYGSKIWFYKDNCLVIDCVWDSYRIAFDIHQTPDEVQLKILGRNSESNHYIDHMLHGRESATLSDKNHRLVRSWPSNFQANFLTKNIADQINWLYMRRSAKPVESVQANESTNKMPVSTYWWNGRTNFGDLIGPWLVNEISGKEVVNQKDSTRECPTLVTVGSVLNLLERKDADIWGSGLIAPLHEASIKRMSAHKPRKIHAVRGWKTYKELTEKMGWDVPRIFGDPALLLPRFFTPERDSSKKITVVPHYLHSSAFTLVSENIHIVNVERQAQVVVSEIANSDVVIATSLHGLIVAQAYGIPWVWLRIEDKKLAGDQFKFEDFFTVLERSQVAEHNISLSDVNTIDYDELRRKARLPKNKFSFNDLLDAYPADFR